MNILRALRTMLSSAALLGACGEELATSDAGSVADVRQEATDPTLGELAARCTPQCTATVLCGVTGEGAESVFAERAPFELCVCQLLPETPSAGLYATCIVAPNGDLSVAIMGGSVALKNEGFTHSEYGGGNIPSTLSAANEARCTAARARLSSVASAPALPGYCAQLANF